MLGVATILADRSSVLATRVTLLQTLGGRMHILVLGLAALVHGAINLGLECFGFVRLVNEFF